MTKPHPSAQPPAKPFGGELIDIALHRSLRRKFGLRADEIRKIDIALAIEYGLIDKPRDH